MGRNANYSIVASMSQGVANKYIQSYFASKVSPQPIPLPSPVTVGGVAVTLAGTVAFLPPEVVFASNSANAVSVSLAFAGAITFTAGAMAAQTISVTLYTTLSLPIKAQISLGNLLTGIDFTQASVTLVGVEVIEVSSGEPAELVYRQAVTSGSVADALTAALRIFNPSILPIGPLNIPGEYTLIQRRSPPLGSSEFPPFPAWFTVDLKPTAIAPVVLDGAVSVGVDLNGWTQGDASQLQDLNTVFAPGSYIETGYQDGTQSWSAPAGGPRNTDLAVLIDGPTLSRAIAEQICAPMTGTLIDDHIEIREVSFTPGYFDAGADGSGFGATAVVALRYDTKTHRLTDGWGYFAPDDGTPVFDVSITMHLQWYLTQRAGSTSWVAGSRDHWRMRVVDTQIGVPSWLEPAVLFVAISLPALILPVMSFFSWLTALVGDSELQAQLTMADGLISSGANAALDAMAQPAQQNLAFPGTTSPQWLTILGSLALTGDGIDAGVKFAPSAWPSLQVNGNPVSNPFEWNVYNLSPIIVSVALPDGTYRADDPSIYIDWTVTRTDTGAMIGPLTGTQQWAAAGGVASITIDHASPDLDPIPGFQVQCRFYRRLGYRIDEVFTGEQTIRIDDIFDRSHPYVHWSHVVHFANPASTPKHPLHSWERDRSSTIHRTEVAVRCLEMRRRGMYATVGYNYLDNLPGDIDALRQAHQICDYCFFGGPTKTTLLP
jgi:hypothetical protein